jgi:hypothetical protein
MPGLRSRKPLLMRLAAFLVALCGLAVYWFGSPAVSRYGTLLFVVIMLLLLKQSAKYVAPGPADRILIPRLKAKWDSVAVRNGILYLAATALWCLAMGVATRSGILDRLPRMLAVFIVLIPFFTLLLLGVFSLAKGLHGFQR